MRNYNSELVGQIAMTKERLMSVIKQLATLNKYIYNLSNELGEGDIEC